MMPIDTRAYAIVLCEPDDDARGHRIDADSTQVHPPAEMRCRRYGISRGENCVATRYQLRGETFNVWLNAAARSDTAQRTTQVVDMHDYSSFGYQMRQPRRSIAFMRSRSRLQRPP